MALPVVQQGFARQDLCRSGARPRARAPLCLGLIAAAALALGWSSAARAQDPAASTPSQATPTTADAPVVLAAQAPGGTRFGVGVRAPRWVSVPGWLLNLFSAENVPLSTFGSVGLEFIGRRRDYDIVVGLNYQNMSPADGNWLGKNKDASIETDFVQMRDVALWGADVSFVSRRTINEYVGFHYGAGLGLALLRGDVLRTSNAGCTAANAGNEAVCRPTVCPASGCTEAALKATEGRTDSPGSPSRFKDRDVPGAVPILNLTLGMNFRLPNVPGVEARLEGGFHNAFFLGTSFAYIFR